MRPRASLILIAEQEVLLIYRENAKGTYYVLPGGKVEEGETPAEAASRELIEEAGIKVDIVKELGEFMDTTIDHHVYFLSGRLIGEKVTPEWQEKDKQTADNIYRFEWCKAEKIETINLLPELVKSKIISELSFLS